MISIQNVRPLRFAFALLLLLSSSAACKGHGEASASMLDSLAGREKRETKYDNGQKKEDFFVVKDKAGNYVKDGPYVSFHQTGQKSEAGAYRADAPDGHWLKWDESGKLTLDVSYKNGKRDGAFKRYAGGALNQSGSYTDDKLVGPFKYLGIDGFVVAGDMAADTPVGAWSIADRAGKARARATFKDGNPVGGVQSLADDGSVRLLPPAKGCADFGGYALGTVHWADVIFDSLARTHTFPEDDGINQYSGGRMLKLPAALLSANGIEKMTLIFDRDDLLTALTATAEKQRGSSAYANVIKQLHAEYAKKYTTVSASMPYVGDCHAEYRSGGCGIVLDAPHMGFDMQVTLRSEAFEQRFKAAAN